MPGAGSLEAFEGGSCAQQQTFSLQLPTWIDLHMCWYPLIWETSRIYGCALLTVPQQFMGTGATFYYVFMVFFHLACILDSMWLTLLSVVERHHR